MQLGRKGGMRNRHVYETDDKEVAPPQNASDVKNLLADAMAEIRAGKRSQTRDDARLSRDIAPKGN